MSGFIFAILVLGASWLAIPLPNAVANQEPWNACEYLWTDSVQDPPAWVNYSWIDIRANGTAVTSWTHGDDGYAGPFPLGFSFPFFGETRTEVFIQTNGYLSFGRGYDLIPVELPDSAVVALGADLVVAGVPTPTAVYYKQLTAPNRFVVEYYDAYHAVTWSRSTFEIILYENGEIWFQYDTVGGVAWSIGIRKSDGREAHYPYVSLVGRTAIQFSPVAPATALDGVAIAPCYSTYPSYPGAREEARHTITNTGTGGADTFDVTYQSTMGWNVSLFEADGTTLLSDTNGNFVPDTGPLVSRGTTGIVVTVDVPLGTESSDVITVTATSARNASVSRTVEVAVALVLSLVGIPADRGIDVDGDGQYNYLEVTANLSVGYAGTFLFDWQLYDATLRLNLVESQTLTLGPGISIITVQFNGWSINETAVDGPYKVALRGSLFRIHVTGNYSHIEFEGPPLAFVPPHADMGVDIDGDQLYDYLRISASVEVEEAGMYSFTARLSGGGGALVIDTSTDAFLGPGLQSVPLEFSGQTIARAGTDGPYEISMVSRNPRGTVLDQDIHMTRAYSYRDFDEFAAGGDATFGYPHADRGVDADGDGKLDYLEVSLAVRVNVQGTFEVAGILSTEGATGLELSFNESFLGAGDRRISLWFDGYVLNASGLDGPYFIDALLFDADTSLAIDSTIHGTAAYRSASFEAPPMIVSTITKTVPVVDGTLNPGEWDDAVSVPLISILGNEIAGFVLVKHDRDRVYLAYDATGDVTRNDLDAASIAFDTSNDRAFTDGAEDQFVQGGWVSYNQAHLVYRSNVNGWVVQDSPFNLSLRDHTALASAWGFGASVRSPAPHRIYEFAIPFALLGVAPGQRVGFMTSSWATPGLFDAARDAYSQWPSPRVFPGRPHTYGALELPTDTTPPVAAVVSPKPGTIFSWNSIEVRWTATDDGFGLERIEIRLDDGDPTALPPDSTNYTFTNVPEGRHTIVVAVIDLAGNVGSASIDIIVDTNIWSLTGPYGPGPFIALLIAITGSASAILIFAIRRVRGRRNEAFRRQRPPMHDEPPPT